VRKRHCHISLAPDFANLPVLEKFIAACPFLDASEINRALLVTTEFFDNIVAHSRCFNAGKVAITLEKAAAVIIRLSYRTCNFLEMVRADGTTKPYFDGADRRYRGLGLLMCRNLAGGIHYRKGLLKSSIIIIL